MFGPEVDDQFVGVLLDAALELGVPVGAPVTVKDMTGQFVVGGGFAADPGNLSVFAWDRALLGQGMHLA